MKQFRTVTPDDLEGDLVPPDDPRFGIIWINPQRMGGEPCFFGTRIPVQSLWDHLEAGDSLDVFLADFDVTREHAIAVIQLAGRHLVQDFAA